MTYSDQTVKERKKVWKLCLQVRWDGPRWDEHGDALVNQIVQMERDLDALRHEVQVKRLAEEEITEQLGLKPNRPDESPIHALIDAYRVCDQ